MRTIALALFFLLSASADAQIVITKAGYFLISQEANGIPVFVDLKIKPDTPIIDLRESTPPTVPPVTPNPTDPVALHRTAIQAALDKVPDKITDATTGKVTEKKNVKPALKVMYESVAGLPVTKRDDLVTATTTIFNTLHLPPAWSTWKAEVDQSLNRFVALDDAKKGWQIVAEVLAK